MATQTMKAHDELARLDEAIKAAEQRRNDAQTRAREQLAEVQASLDRDALAFASGDDRLAEDVRTERAALTEANTTWSARIAACGSAVEQARHARSRFVEEHGDDLLAELAPDADAIVQRVEAALSETSESIVAYAKLQQRLNGFVHHSRHQPDPAALSVLATALERAAAVPNPMPKPALIEEEVA